jgi:hypothetical protein
MPLDTHGLEGSGDAVEEVVLGNAKDLLPELIGGVHWIERDESNSDEDAVGAQEIDDSLAGISFP